MIYRERNAGVDPVFLPKEDVADISDHTILRALHHSLYVAKTDKPLRRLVHLMAILDSRHTHKTEVQLRVRSVVREHSHTNKKR